MAVVLSEHQKKKIKQLEGATAGKGSMKAKVLAFYKDHPDMSVNEMAKQLGMNYATVRHALISVGKVKATPTAAKKSHTVVPEEFKSTKANEVEGFCPKCGKPLVAHICAVTLHNETYKKSAIGTCTKCHTSFSYHIN